jgi:hypothetical protein
MLRRCNPTVTHALRKSCLLLIDGFARSQHQVRPLAF